MLIPASKLFSNKILLLALWASCFFIPALHAQDAITTTSFLRAAQESRQVESDSANLSFLEDYNYNLPLLRDVQLRTETRDFFLNRQEYTIRIKPNSLSAISRQKKVYQNKIEEVRIENQINFNEELENRYLLLVDYIFIDKLVELYTESQLQLKDKLHLLGQKVYDTDFDVKDLIDTEESLFSVNSKLNDLNEERSIKQSLLLLFLNKGEDDSIEINSNDLIKPQQVAEVSISSLKTENLEVSLQKLKLKTLEREMRLSTARSNQIFDYFQAKYGGRNTVIFEEEFSLGLGINLPFFGNSRKNKGDYYFEKLRKESKLNETLYKIDADQKLAQNEFRRAITNYQSLKKQIDESSVASLLETYKGMEGVSPLLLLKLKILQHKKKIEELKAQQQMYQSYIKVLAQEGILFQEPLLNYLSATLESIE